MSNVYDLAEYRQKKHITAQTSRRDNISKVIADNQTNRARITKEIKEYNDAVINQLRNGTYPKYDR